jgi:hypothetical protein
MFCFEYSGGVNPKNGHSNEKFLLFFISGQKEIPFFQLYKNAIIRHPVPGDYTTGITDLNGKHTDWFVVDGGPNHFYESPFPCLKIFLYQGGFNTVKMMKNIYFKIDHESPFTVTVTPFSLHKTGYKFRARGTFLENHEVREMFNPNDKAVEWLDDQNQLPIETLRSIITVRKDKISTRTRQIRKL